MSQRTPVERVDALMRSVSRARRENPSWRVGQTYMNVLILQGHDPGFANMVRGTDLDPYNNDDALPGMMEALIERWSKQVA